MATAPTKFRIDVGIQNLLQNSNGRKPIPVVPKALSLPNPVFPQYPDKLSDPGPEKPPDRNRKWGLHPIYRAMRGWLYPYVRSRVLPGDFHPITSYLFVEYKCSVPNMAKIFPFVAKLPKSRVDQLVTAGAGIRFDPGHGRLMKKWFVAGTGAPDWLELAKDAAGARHTFDSFECAIQAIAPICEHCKCRVIGHGVEVSGRLFCCAHCAREATSADVRDRAA